MALTSKELIARLPPDVQELTLAKFAAVWLQLETRTMTPDEIAKAQAKLEELIEARRKSLAGKKSMTSRELIQRLAPDRQEEILKMSAEINAQRAEARRREMEQPS